MGPVRGFAASSPVTQRLTALATAGAGEQKLASCRRRAVGYGLVLPALVTYLKVSDKMLFFFFAVCCNGEVVASPKGRGGNK